MRHACAQLQKVTSSHRWLVTLVDELLLSTLLTPIQVRCSCQHCSACFRHARCTACVQG